MSMRNDRVEDPGCRIAKRGFNDAGRTKSGESKQWRVVEGENGGGGRIEKSCSMQKSD